MKLSSTALKNRLKSKWLDLNNKIQVIHQLDYPDQPLYMCDNIRIASCTKEPDTIRWIQTFQKDDIAFDIGANVGAYSLVMSLFAKKVYAFEPAVMNHALLCKNMVINIQKNTIPSNIVPLNVALAENIKIDTLNYVNTNLGKSGHQINGRTVDCFGNPFQPRLSHEVLCFSIDSFIELFKLPAPNHMKMDVDGIEWDILKGARKTLADPRMKSLLIESDIDKPETKAIHDLVTSKNFSLAEKYQAEGSIYNHLFKR